MAIRLNTLTHAQVSEVIALAADKASRMDRRCITRTEDLLIDDAPLPELQQLVSAIDQLPTAARGELMTLVWLGMGAIDNDQETWAKLLDAAYTERSNDIPERLALLAQLPEYLQRGLEKVC